MNVMGNGAGSSRTQDRRFARTEKAIVEAFLRLAEERDLSKITVTALAREADIDRKTFYLHYGTVDAVADALLKEEAERVVEVLREEAFFESGTIDAMEFFSKLSVIIAPDLARTLRMVKHVSPDIILSKIEGPLTEALIEDDWPRVGLYGALSGLLRGVLHGGDVGDLSALAGDRLRDPTGRNLGSGEHDGVLRHEGHSGGGPGGGAGG